MPVKGYESYFIRGIQGVDWDTQCAAIETKIYEFESAGVRNEAPPIRPTRFKRNASPAKNIENFVMAGGDIVFNLHADDLVWLFKEMLGDNTVVSVDFVPIELFGDGGGGGKAQGASPITLDTQPNAGACDPGRLVFTLNAPDTGTITLTGTDQNDMAITEVVTFAASASETSVNYYKTVAVMPYTGLAVAVTLLVMGDRNTYTHTIELKDDLLDGQTLEIVKGGLPSVYVGSMINSGVLSIADVLSLTVNWMAKRGFNAHKILVANATPTPSETPTAVGGYTPVSDVFFPAWGMALYVDGAGTPTDIASATMTVNNQLSQPDRYRGIRTKPQPRRSDNREVSLAVGIDYDAAQNDWDEWFYFNQEVSAILECYSRPASGPEQYIKYTMPRCQIGAFPDPAVSDYADIVQDILLQPIKTVGATVPDELSIELVCTAAT